MNIINPPNNTFIFDTGGAPLRPTIADAGNGMTRVDWNNAVPLRPTVIPSFGSSEVIKWNTGADLVMFHDSYGFSFASLGPNTKQSSDLSWLRDYTLSPLYTITVVLDAPSDLVRGPVIGFADGTGWTQLWGQIDQTTGKVSGCRATTSGTAIGAVAFHVLVQGYMATP